jgi:hypothetical protein
VSIPDNHPFAPRAPGSTSCKWCAFAEGAHDQSVPFQQSAPHAFVGSAGAPSEPEEVSGTDLSTWVDPAMYESAVMDESAVARPRVTLLSATPDPLGAVAAMCKMYEGRGHLRSRRDHRRRAAQLLGGVVQDAPEGAAGRRSTSTS